LKIFGVCTSPELNQITKNYEVGHIRSTDFIRAPQDPFIFLDATPKKLLLLNIQYYLISPIERLAFIEQMRGQKNIVYFTKHTNEASYNAVIKSMGNQNFKSVKACFEQFYLSHEINYEKTRTSNFRICTFPESIKSRRTLF